jgi:hypothetical protein
MTPSYGLLAGGRRATVVISQALSSRLREFVAGDALQWCSLMMGGPLDDAWLLQRKQWSESKRPSEARARPRSVTASGRG